MTNGKWDLALFSLVDEHAFTGAPCVWWKASCIICGLAAGFRRGLCRLLLRQANWALGLSRWEKYFSRFFCHSGLRREWMDIDHDSESAWGCGWMFSIQSSLTKVAELKLNFFSCPQNEQLRGPENRQSNMTDRKQQQSIHCWCAREWILADGTRSRRCY